MPGVCKGAGRGAAGCDAIGVSRTAGGAFGHVARACVAQCAGGCGSERWRWRRFAADASWRAAAEFGADVAVGRCGGAAACLGLLDVGSAEDADRHRGDDTTRIRGTERTAEAPRRADDGEA